MADSEAYDGVVYTETVIFVAPEQYAAEAPYQLAIIDLNRGGRLTVRILATEPAERVTIGDKVLFVEERDGVAYYRKKTARAPVNTSEDPASTDLTSLQRACAGGQFAPILLARSHIYDDDAARHGCRLVTARAGTFRANGFPRRANATYAAAEHEQA
jgi:DUF35 OB-fold domain, acyl-CoA-associated